MSKFQFKVPVIGPCGIGKTYWLNQFGGSPHSPTSSDVYEFPASCMGNNFFISLVMPELAGPLKETLKGSDAVFVCCNRGTSPEDLESYVKFVKEYLENDIPVITIVFKFDIDESSEVDDLVDCEVSVDQDCIDEPIEKVIGILTY